MEDISSSRQTILHRQEPEKLFLTRADFIRSHWNVFSRLHFKHTWDFSLCSSLLSVSLSLNAVRMSEQLNPAGFLAFLNSLNHVRTVQNNDFSGNWILSHPNIFVANRRQDSWREECQPCNGNRSLSWRNQAFSIVLSWRQSFKAQLWDWHAHRSLNNTAWDLPNESLQLHILLQFSPQSPG